MAQISSKSVPQNIVSDMSQRWIHSNSRFSVFVQKLLDQKAQVLWLKRHLTLVIAISMCLVKSPGTFQVFLVLSLFTSCSPVLFWQCRASILIPHTFDEAWGEQFIGTVEEWSFGFVLRLVCISIFIFVVFGCPIELVVDEFLLFLNVPKHVFAFGKAHKVGKHMWVLFIELAKFRQTNLAFLFTVVEALEKLVDVV